MTSANPPRLPCKQPLGLLDLISLSFRLWRKDLRLVFRALIMPTILYFGSGTVLQWCFTYGIAGTSNDLAKIVVTVGFGLLALIVYLIALCWLWERQLALLRYFMGFSPSWDAALAFSRQKFVWIIGLFFILVLFGTVIGAAMGCLIGLSVVMLKMGAAGAVIGTIGISLGFVGLILSMSILIVLCFMVLPVLACEENSFLSVLSRTFHWTFKHFGRVACFCFIFYVIFWAVSMPVSLPVVLVSFADMTWNQLQSGTAAGSERLSLSVMIFAQFWEGLCSLLLRPVSVIAFGLLYLDLRQRSDAIDLTLKLRQLQSKAGQQS